MKVKLLSLFVILGFFVFGSIAYGVTTNIITPNSFTVPIGQQVASYDQATGITAFRSIPISNGTGSNPYIISNSILSSILSNNTNIGLDGSIKQAQGSTLADLHAMNNQTLYGNTKVDYLTIKENYQLPKPPCGSVNIRAEPITHEVQLTDCQGHFTVLSQQTPYYYSTQDTPINSIGYSKAFYDGTSSAPFESHNDGSVRLPIWHGGLIRHAQCNVANNTKNNVTVISIEENGGPVSSISIPAGGWGTSYEFAISTNLNPESQLTWKLDTHLSTSGIISFFCNAQ